MGHWCLVAAGGAAVKDRDGGDRSAYHHPAGSVGVGCTRFAMLVAARKMAKPVLRGVTTWEVVTERYIFVSGSGVVAREVSVIDTWVRTVSAGVVAIAVKDG